VHLWGTHGERFTPLQRVFSNNEYQTKNWMTDFYDDAIIDFDTEANRVLEHLSQTGKLNNTIVIIYSDHGMVWTSNERIPLLIWLPDADITGTVQTNAQLADITPTILNYLGVVQPECASPVPMT